MLTLDKTTICKDCGCEITNPEKRFGKFIPYCKECRCEWGRAMWASKNSGTYSNKEGAEKLVEISYYVSEYDIQQRLEPYTEVYSCDPIEVCFLAGVYNW